MPCSGRCATRAGGSAIDTDRVFLTGHGIGGDAVWDIGSGPPGYLGRRDPDRGGRRPVLSDVTRRTRDYVSWYVVAGELDGDKMARNARELDRYLTPVRRPHGSRILGPRVRAVWRRDTTAVRLDGPAASQRCRRKSNACRCGRGTISSGGSKWKALPERSMVLPGNWPPGRSCPPDQYRRQAVGNQQNIGESYRPKK